ncbi:MAG TPA: phosphatase domain-containing protein [Thermoanaerobaculia bacterium]
MVKRAAHRLAAGLERHIDRRAGSRRSAATKLVISPYRGFGRGHELFVRGRVLVERAITRATEAEPVWRNLMNAYRRFHSREVGGARVIARYRDAVMEGMTDDEGHFQLRLEPRELDPALLWHDVTVELPETSTGALAHVIVPQPAAEFGVISDIDDTIVRTGATSLLTMARTVLLQNAASRVPFEGVSELYRALHRDANPIFYVSSSPWNLHDLIADFMQLQGVPHGPLFLQDWGIDDVKLIYEPHTVHKAEEIRRILEFYPDLPFVLIGDSGQHDPEIYLDVIRSFPTRIRAAFIRDVTTDIRDRAVAALIDEAKSAGVEMVYVATSAEAMTHARRMGLVA